MKKQKKASRPSITNKENREKNSFPADKRMDESLRLDIYKYLAELKKQ